MALREVVAVFDIQVKDAALKAAGKGVDGLAGALKGLGGIIAGAAVVGGIKSMISGATALEGSINDVSERVGVSAQHVQEWQYVLGQTGGTAADVEPIFRTLAKNLGEVGGEASKGMPLVKELLGSDYETKGKGLDTIAKDAALAISQIPDEANRGKAAFDLFGKSGTKLVNVFGQGKAGYETMMARFEEVGGALSEDALSTLSDLGDRTADYDHAMDVLKAQLVVGITPALIKFNNTLGKVAAGLKNDKEAMGHLKNILIGIGLAGAVALAPIIGMVLTLGLVGLVVDDLIVAFEGGDAAITRLLDKMFGKGSGKDIFDSVRTSVKDVTRAIKEGDAATAIWDATLGALGKNVKKFFTDDIPAAIGVATGHMRGAETTWRDLFKTAWELQNEDTNKRHKEYQDLAGKAATGDLAASDELQAKKTQAIKELAQWENAPEAMRKGVAGQYAAKGMKSPEELWRENANKLIALTGMTGTTSDIQGENDRFKAFQAQVQSENGFAVTRVNEEYGTRVSEPNMNIAPNTVVNVVINTLDAGAMTAVKGEVISAVNRGNEAALVALKTAAP